MSEQDLSQATACDLCGCDEPLLLRDATQTRNRAVVCPQCRLIYASPRPPVEVLQRHYDEEFRGDAGGNARAEQGVLDDRYVEVEEARARKWAAPLVERFLDVRGKDVLDLRCQTGALAAVLAERGAHVRLVDPFDANLRYANDRRGLAQTTRLPMYHFHELSGEANSFDAITALNEHVPGHVLFCREFFNRMFVLLKPGGHFFLDEKDVLRPTRFKVPSILDSGVAHIHHFMPHTLKGFLQSAGFEILECELDRDRKTSFRHFRTIARKPVSPNAHQNGASWDGPSLEAIRWKIWWSERRWQLTRARRWVKHGFRRRAA